MAELNTSSIVSLFRENLDALGTPDDLTRMHVVAGLDILQDMGEVIDMAYNFELGFKSNPEFPVRISVIKGSPYGGVRLWSVIVSHKTRGLWLHGREGDWGLYVLNKDTNEVKEVANLRPESLGPLDNYVTEEV